ncbi:hypothetical protein AGR7C_Cc230096 [Agrobacterium deltaense Zutra 3/1]|uniref:Uncharacterized protein n=1 Tax=Agrobacterium deltaense Zutra 3/1 TaxID=1183427 RepID=A0A1S7Q0T4_9HYPH|nr:hypothetical protein AGR7C_Cc230096 [Agrobacterium deltaense Zutra 3/1]
MGVTAIPDSCFVLKHSSRSPRYSKAQTGTTRTLSLQFKQFCRDFAGTYGRNGHFCGFADRHFYDGQD